MRKPFSEQEKQILIETVNSGKSIRKTSLAIAKSMGRSEMSVRQTMYTIRKKLGLAPERKKRDPNYLKLMETYGENLMKQATRKYTQRKKETRISNQEWLIDSVFAENFGLSEVQVGLLLCEGKVLHRKETVYGKTFIVISKNSYDPGAESKWVLPSEFARVHKLTLQQASTYATRGRIKHKIIFNPYNSKLMRVLDLNSTNWK